VKRAIYIFIGLSLITALLVFFLRREKKDEEPSETQPQLSPGVAARGPAPGHLPPPMLVRPDAGAANPAEPEISPETALLRQVRDNYKSNPAKAVEAALEARQRFGDSPDSDERDGLLVQAYIYLHDMAAARAEMPYYYQHHPRGRWDNYLFALTNVGPNSPP
jgi:LAS superfamily LD-carboxypeptidase LdcB